jgi:hypothetical protein
MAAEGKNTRAKKRSNALATLVGYPSTIQVNLGVMEVAELPASYAKIQGATKIRILFFSQSTVGYSGRRNRNQKNFN